MLKKLKLEVGKKYRCTVKKIKERPVRWNDLGKMDKYMGRKIICSFAGDIKYLGGSFAFETSGDSQRYWWFRGVDFSKVEEVPRKV